MLRALVIGTSGRGTTWVRAIREHEQFELSGIADVQAEALQKVGEEYRVSPDRRHLDYRQALASGHYDAAVIVVPNHLHYPIAKDVLNAGLHGLVEKPFTMDLKQARELVGLAGRKKRVLEVVQNYRFSPVCRFVGQVIAEQRLGRLSGIEASFHRNRPPRYEHERTMPFPMLFLQGIHHLDYLVAVLPSPIVKVTSYHHRPAWSPWQNPAVCHAILQCEDGVLVNYRGSYESQGEISTYDGFWRFEFERGDLIVDKDLAVWQVTEQDQKREPAFQPPPEAKSGDTWLLDTLHEAITTGVEPPTSGRRNLQTLKLLFSVIKGRL